MPIRPEFRHFYRGPEWAATRKRILDRARDRCEECRKPNGIEVFRVTWKEIVPVKFGQAKVVHRMCWIKLGGKIWRDQWGRPVAAHSWPARAKLARIRGQIGVAHVDNNPANMDDRNLRAWCNWCHLNHDEPFHRDTRCSHKDPRRPLLAMTQEAS